MTARVATVEKASHLPPGTTYKQSAFERHWEAIRAEEVRIIMHYSCNLH